MKYVHGTGHHMGVCESRDRGHGMLMTGGLDKGPGTLALSLWTDIKGGRYAQFKEGGGERGSAETRDTR